MDGFSFHPYPNPSDFTVPFTFTYGWPNASVLDLARIKQALWDAFNGTAQPTTVEGLKLYLDEVGWQVDTSTGSRATRTSRTSASRPRRRRRRSTPISSATSPAIPTSPSSTSSATTTSRPGRLAGGAPPHRRQRAALERAPSRPRSRDRGSAQPDAELAAAREAGEGRRRVRRSSQASAPEAQPSRFTPTAARGRDRDGRDRARGDSCRRGSAACSRDAGALDAERGVRRSPRPARSSRTGARARGRALGRAQPVARRGLHEPAVQAARVGQGEARAAAGEKTPSKRRKRADRAGGGCLEARHARGPSRVDARLVPLLRVRHAWSTTVLDRALGGARDRGVALVLVLRARRAAAAPHLTANTCSCIMANTCSDASSCSSALGALPLGRVRAVVRRVRAGAALRRPAGRHALVDRRRASYARPARRGSGSSASGTACAGRRSCRARCLVLP